MTVAPRISPSELFTADEWVPFKRRSAWRGLLLVAHASGVIVLAGFLHHLVSSGDQHRHPG